MYRSTRYESSDTLNFKIPWDANTARGFGLSMLVFALFAITAPWMAVEPPSHKGFEINIVPLELLNFGNGDGTGASKGNLTEEGALHKGSNPASDLQDAQISGKVKNKLPENTSDIKEANDFIASTMMPSSESSNAQKGSYSKNIGSTNGSDFTSGMGLTGLGAGKGLGYGDIEWGGGGNRTVLYKKLPQYPQGVNTSAQIKIRFTVFADGTVGKMFPMQKGDPSLEKAAMDALRQWRFNPLKDSRNMEGIITFTFRLS